MPACLAAAPLLVLQQALQYQPTVSLEEGLRRFATWFKQYYGSALDVGATVPEDWVSGAVMTALKSALHAAFAVRLGGA